MYRYVVSYDLNAPGQKYTKLHELIDSTSNAWCRPLSSFYLVRTNLSVNELSDRIRSILDDNDHFLIISVSNNKQGWLDEEQWEYIEKNIF